MKSKEASITGRGNGEWNPAFLISIYKQTTGADIQLLREKIILPESKWEKLTVAMVIDSRQSETTGMTPIGNKNIEIQDFHRNPNNL